MSVKLMGRVWELDLPHAQQSVALALADHGKDDGSSIFPSVGHVAWKVGYSDRQVQRILRQLVEIGLLAKVAEAVGHRPTEYRMCVDAVPEKPPWEPRGDNLSPRQDVAPTPDVTPGVTSTTARGDIATSPEPSPEPPENHQTPADAGVVSRENDPDAIRLCGLLASLMRENDPKVKLPKADSANREAWIRQMRLLIHDDRDGDVAEVEFVIRWCQTDDFEQSNILSPGKLRKRFTELKLKADRQRDRRGHLAATSTDPLAGLTPEQRARAIRTQERLARIQQQTNPTQGAIDGHVSDREGRRAGGQDRPPQPALASGH